MSFVDVDKLKVTERLPGWRGRYFHAVNMTVAHYEFTRGASIHEHHHPQEELYEVLEGELELTVDGVTQVLQSYASGSGPFGQTFYQNPTVIGVVEAHGLAILTAATLWFLATHHTGRFGH